jgi:hypothetical protein
MRVVSRRPQIQMGYGRSIIDLIPLVLFSFPEKAAIGRQASCRAAANFPVASLTSSDGSGVPARKDPVGQVIPLSLSPQQVLARLARYVV